ncbi:hypothetical protein [Microcoleus sp. D2_18a_D3]
MDGTNQTAEITDRVKLDELALKVYEASIEVGTLALGSVKI